MSQIDMTFNEHRILLLQAMSISLREKQYTVAYIKWKIFQCINQRSLHLNTLGTHVSALILKHYLPAFIKVSKTSVLVSR